MATPRASHSWTSAATSPATVHSTRPPRWSMASTRTLSPVIRHRRASTWSPPSSTTACSAAIGGTDEQAAGRRQGALARGRLLALAHEPGHAADDQREEHYRGADEHHL